MRQSVKWFAERMELTLALHDEERGSDGWLNEDILWLFDRLKEEVEELESKIAVHEYTYLEGVGIMKECFDVANFAMMIADSVR